MDVSSGSPLHLQVSVVLRGGGEGCGGGGDGGGCSSGWRDQGGQVRSDRVTQITGDEQQDGILNIHEER